MAPSAMPLIDRSPAFRLEPAIGTAPTTEVVATALTPVTDDAELIDAAFAAALPAVKPGLCVARLVEAPIVVPLITMPLVALNALAGTTAAPVPPYDPNESVVAPATLTEMIWLALAPTWNCAAENVPSSRFRPLNCVCVATRDTSASNCVTSEFSAARSDDELVALADCRASSRIRCRLSPTWDNAPSAVCAKEIPSFALRDACVRPRIWVVNRSEIARPAASSFALLMRRPEDRRWMACACAACELF